MVEFARRFLGLPYLWGGTSTFGYDCSGFTQMLERQRGIETPRDTQPQADWTGVVQISRDDLKPGDLLFFGRSDKKITHTGLYIGSDEFIHATAHVTPVIQISRLSDPHWTGLLVACRRVK
jgi:cell wall-associated NlpC family hydrolase